MAAGLTLDAGALIAAEKNDREFWRLWKDSVQRGQERTVAALVIAQSWRENHPLMAKVINACRVEPFPADKGKSIGTLLARAGTGDVVDATVVDGAAQRGDAVATSDPDDIRRLMNAARYRGIIVAV